MGHIGQKTAFGGVRALGGQARAFFGLEYPPGGGSVDDIKCGHDQTAYQYQNEKHLGILDNIVGLFHDDPVGDNGHQIPSRRIFHGHVTEHVVFFLIVEAGSPFFSKLQCGLK